MKKKYIYIIVILLIIFIGFEIGSCVARKHSQDDLIYDVGNELEEYEEEDSATDEPVAEEPDSDEITPQSWMVDESAIRYDVGDTAVWCKTDLEYWVEDDEFDLDEWAEEQDFKIGIHDDAVTLTDFGRSREIDFKSIDGVFSSLHLNDSIYGDIYITEEGPFDRLVEIADDKWVPYDLLVVCMFCYESVDSGAPDDIIGWMRQLNLPDDFIIE